MNAHFPQNELARAEAYGIGKCKYAWISYLKHAALSIYNNWPTEVCTASGQYEYDMWTCTDGDTNLYPLWATPFKFDIEGCALILEQN